jgi:site-specific recombinase XerD
MRRSISVVREYQKVSLCIPSEKATIISLDEQIGRLTMDFGIIKNDYLQYIQHELNLAHSTFVTYQSWLNRYERWLTDEGMKDPGANQALSVTILRKYLYSLSGAKLRPRTLRAAFHPLRGLCAFLVREGYLAESANPMKRLNLPKKDAARRQVVEDTEVVALFDAAEKQLDPYDVAFSSAILATLCYTGIRASELVDLTLKDISVESGTLLVASGKGRKSRTLYPPESFFVAYKGWLAEREKISPTHDYVWTQGANRRISDEWLRRHLEEIKAIAGLKGHENIKPHSLRHWFATRMLRNGATIKQIQVALGHADIKTTAIYLHINEEDCKAMAKLAEFDISSLSQPKSNKKGNIAREPEQDNKVSRVRESSNGTKHTLQRRRSSRRL